MEWAEYFDVDVRVLGYPAGRRAVGARSPMLFALIYLRNHLMDDFGQITLAEPHHEWSNLATRLAMPTGLREFRHIFVAPRECAKTTWWYLIIPMWLAAYGHRSFIAAFADSATQAELHLYTFKNELLNNEAIRSDFPELCRARTMARGRTAADRINMYMSESGFVFAARGIDAKTLGLKVENKRPDMIILDDVESDERRYSVELAGKRLGTITDAILPLNEKAAVVWTGTVTMAGGLIHQAVRSISGTSEPWLISNKFICHHHLPILKDDNGGERSIWPQKWPLDYLKSIRNTRSYAKNFLNMPLSGDGKYWTPELIKYGSMEVSSMRVLSIDPHVKKGKNTDYTGLVFVAYSIKENRFLVEWSLATKLRGLDLRRLVQRTVAERNATAVLLETNQGGDLWTDPGGPLSDLGVSVITVHQSESKEIRAERALVEYEAGRVMHAESMDELESQMTAFPNVAHDDLVDALTSVIILIRKRVQKAASSRPARAVQGSYSA